MSTLIGNIFLSIAALIFLALFNMMYLQKIPKTGESLMGYGWGIILGYLAILACMILVAGMIGWKGGFSWIGNSTAARWMIVPGGLILAVFTAGLCAFFKGEPMQVPEWMKSLSGLLCGGTGTGHCQNQNPPRVAEGIDQATGMRLGARGVYFPGFQ